MEQVIAELPTVLDAIEETTQYTDQVNVLLMNAIENMQKPRPADNKSLDI